MLSNSFVALSLFALSLFRGLSLWARKRKPARQDLSAASLSSAALLDFIFQLSIYYLLIKESQNSQLNFLKFCKNAQNPLKPSGTKKSFPLDFPKFFLFFFPEWCTHYMKYISLSCSLYLYLSDMHLEEISRLLKYHCNHSVFLREWISISYTEFIFSSDVLKQLAVAPCNQQNFLLCGRHSCWAQSRQKGSVFLFWFFFFFLLTADILKESLPHWMTPAPLKQQHM